MPKPKRYHCMGLKITHTRSDEQSEVFRRSGDSVTMDTMSADKRELCYHGWQGSEGWGGGPADLRITDPLIYICYHGYIFCPSIVLYGPSAALVDIHSYNTGIKARV